MSVSDLNTNWEDQPVSPALAAEGGPAHWVGKDMRTHDEWIYRFTESDVRETMAAVAALGRDKRPLATLTAADFPLPRLADKLHRFRDIVLDGRGFILLRGLPVSEMDARSAAMAYWGIGLHIGRARSQNQQGHLLGHVCDLGLDLENPTTRVYQTTKRQTFHTDSCDIVSLLCLKTAKSGGLSSLVSSVAIHDRMLKERPDLAHILYQPFATDRRGEIPAGAKPYFWLPVFNRFAGKLSTIYARRYIQSAQRFSELPRLTPIQLEALDFFDGLAEDPEMRLDMEFQPGDIQMICNHVILHDRTAYEDWPQPEKKRHLLRLWLSPPVGRPLPEIFAQRYGSVTVGDRGGIVTPATAPCVPLDPTGDVLL